MKSDFFKFRVYVEDTDMFGIVYHANYLKIFERARTEWLRKRGFHLTEMVKDDTNFVIRRAIIEYQSPAYLDDELMIETQAYSMGFCQMRFIQKMYNQFQKLLSEFEVEVVCVNAKMAPKRLPKEIAKELCV